MSLISSAIRNRRCIAWQRETLSDLKPALGLFVVVEIRQWEPADNDAVIAGFMKTYGGAPWFDSWTPETAEQYLLEFQGMPRSATLVAVADGELAAATFFHARTWQESSEIYIDEFFVFPKFQGKGVGAALLAAVRVFATENGVASLALLTDRDKPAFEFYERNGLTAGRNQVFMFGSADPS